jgi:hypothetical protein
MSGFWSDKPDTVEGMMLDTNAAEIDTEESPEIISYLPDLQGKDVLEIGSGIGYVQSKHFTEYQPLFRVVALQAKKGQASGVTDGQPPPGAGL